jgi:hypothetical protein
MLQQVERNNDLLRCQKHHRKSIEQKDSLLKRPSDEARQV